MPRRAAKVDANHTEIVKGLRQSGCTVLDLSAVGKGCPDLLIGRCGYNLLMEVKDGSKPKSARKLTGDQIAFFAKWRGNVQVVKSLQEAIDIINETIKHRK
jgi:Holliday junction resolvase